ncbi:hypothetical protein D6745_02330 [Candidatus Woesearchaeota archaeon]|nr:MAG: hypothetical protein D6745_02330 [Candidatus Woesearchaeota archaeon]
MKFDQFGSDLGEELLRDDKQFSIAADMACNNPDFASRLDRFLNISCYDRRVCKDLAHLYNIGLIRGFIGRRTDYEAWACEDSNPD